MRNFKALLGAASVIACAAALASCNFNAAVVVNLPSWKGDEKSVVFLGARPQSSCSGDPSKLTLAFLLRDDREAGIEEGSRLRTGNSTIVLRTVRSTAGEAPTLDTSDVTVNLGGLVSDGDGGVGDADGGVTPFGANITALRYVPFTSPGREDPNDRRDPVPAALLLDNGVDVQTDDDEGARLDGCDSFTEGFLCQAQGEDRCPFGTTELEVIELDDSVVTALAPFVTDPDAVKTKLDLLRDAARARGDGPVYDGLAKGAPEVRDEATRLGASARGALVLLTLDGRNESKATLAEALADVGDTAVFIAAREVTPELRQIACESGGLLRPVAAAADYGDALMQIRDALRGRFEVDLDVAALANLDPGDHEITGTIEVTIGGLGGTADVSFIITVPGA